MYYNNTAVELSEKNGCICRCSDKECQLLRCGRQTKLLEMQATLLPNGTKEQLVSVT
jgi:hypothetical protein